jgi:CheY-like chemotaxis protein
MQESKTEEYKGTGLVLLIEDDAIIRQTTAAILESFDFEVLEAANGELGVALVREHRETISAIILDLEMPMMDGIETLAHLETIAPTIPVILSSGYDTAHASKRFGANRLAGFLQKPTRVDELLQKLKDVIRKSGEGA